MNAVTKSKLLWGLAFLLGIAAAGCAVLGFLLIQGGAYPPEGTGSLGHVGMVVAGIIAAFLALIFGAFTLFSIVKARAGARSGQALSARGQDKARTL